MADTAHIYHHRVHYIIQEKYINMPYRKPNTHKQPLSIFKNISDLLISLNIFQSSMTPTWSACIHLLISEQVLLGLMNERVSSVCIMMKIDLESTMTQCMFPYIGPITLLHRASNNGILYQLGLGHILPKTKKFFN